MKNSVLLLSLLSFLISCTAKVDYVILSGQITNPAGETLTIRGNGYSQSITVDEEGKFSDTLYLEKGYYTFSHKENTAMYLEPGYNLNMTLDTDQFDETIEYNGLGSAPNNYLKAKYLINEGAMSSGKELWLLDEGEFVAAYNRRNDSLVQTLENFSGMSPEFMVLEKRGIEYNYLSSLMQYPAAYSYYSKDTTYEMSESVAAPFKGLDYENEEDFQYFTDYQFLVRYNFLHSKDLTNKDTLQNAIESMRKVSSTKIRDVLAQAMMRYLGPSSKHLDLYYDGLKTLTDDSTILANAESRYNTTLKILPGKAAPYFQYATNKGDSLNIDDFKGKPIYIDVWATWCGPCIAEIPDLKRVEKQFHEDVHFISISIDSERDIQKWKDMIVEKELAGTHLYAPGTWRAQIMTDFGINGIPRFILLDENGIIINANAPRPSNTKLVELLNESIGGNS